MEEDLANFSSKRKGLALLPVGVERGVEELIPIAALSTSNDGGGAKSLKLIFPLFPLIDRDILGLTFPLFPLIDRDILLLEVDLVIPAETLPGVLVPRLYVFLRVGNGRGELAPDFAVLTLPVGDDDG